MEREKQQQEQARQDRLKECRREVVEAMMLRRGSCPSGKICYLSGAEARTFEEWQWGYGMIGARMREYECPECGSWHLTRRGKWIPEEDYRPVQKVDQSELSWDELVTKLLTDGAGRLYNEIVPVAAQLSG